MLEEIKARQQAPMGQQIAYAIRDRDTLLEFVDEIQKAFDESQENPVAAVEEVLVAWGLVYPF